MKVWGTYISILISCSTIAFSQTIDELLIVTNSVYEANKSALSFPKNQEYLDPFFNFSKLPESSSVIHNQIAVKEVEKKLHKNNLGLQLKASANYNLDVIPDEETNINIRSSLRTELEWKILKNGFIANRRRALVTQNEIFQLEEDKNRADAELWRRQLKRKYIYAINEELKIVLNQKQQFLNQYFDVVQSLYQQKYIGRNTIIDLGHQIHINDQKIEGLEVYNKTLQDSSMLPLQQLKLPLLQVYNTTVDVAHQMKVSEDLALSNAALQSHWLENVNFSVYVNQNWIRLQTQNRDFTSVGLRLTAPLFHSYQKELIQKKQALIKAQFQDKNVGKTNRWIVQFSEYQEKIKDLNGQYKKWELLEEQLRVAQILKEELSTNEFGIKNLDRQRYQFEILETVLEIKKQLYKAVIELKVMVPDLKYAPFKFKSTMEKQQVMITTESVYPYELQFSFLQAKGISKVFIANPTEKIKQLGEKYQIEIEQTTSIGIKTVDNWINEEIRSLKD